MLLPQPGSGFSQVKWSKDGHQLYKIDSNGEKTDYRLPGIHVVVRCKAAAGLLEGLANADCRLPGIHVVLRKWVAMAR